MLNITSITKEQSTPTAKLNPLESILAGIAIGIGAMVFLAVDDKIIGSFLFSIGLFIVCSFNLPLFTGRTCYVFSDDGGQLNGSAFLLVICKRLLSLVCIWFGNFFGTYLICGGVNMTRIYDQLSTKATALWDVKVQDSTESLIVLGIICNVLIFMGVENYKRNQSGVGKYLGIILSVMGFILIGSEHCVADMAYLWFVNEDALSAAHFSALIYITIGNLIGGLSIGIINEAYQDRKKKYTELM